MTKIPSKRDPRFNKSQPALNFDNYEEEEITLTTDKEKATNFLSRYQQTIHPITKYEKYFKGSAKDIDHIFNEVKNFYTRLVLRGDWGERKFVTVVNDIFENKATLSLMVFDRCGLMYEKEELASQRRARKSNGLRGRK